MPFKKKQDCSQQTAAAFGRILTAVSYCMTHVTYKIPKKLELRDSEIFHHQYYIAEFMAINRAATVRENRRS